MNSLNGMASRRVKKCHSGCLGRQRRSHVPIGGGNQVVKGGHAFAPTERELLETRFATMKLQLGVILYTQ